MGEDRQRGIRRQPSARAPGTRPWGTLAQSRRLFREMVKGEIEHRPLSWSRRRALARFAEPMGIDLFEARLIIRAIEYECGHVAPAAMADVDTPVESQYLLDAGPQEAWCGWVVAMFIISVACLVALALL